MKLFKLIPVIAFTVIISCTSTTEKKDDAGLVEKPACTPTQAADSGRQAIIESKRLSDEQRKKMLSLMDQTRFQMASIRQEEVKIKSSLFKDLAAGKFEDRELSSYRKQLKKLEYKKMDLMLSNAKEAQKIIGKGIPFEPELINLAD